MTIIFNDAGGICYDKMEKGKGNRLTRGENTEQKQ